MAPTGTQRLGMASILDGKRQEACQEASGQAPSSSWFSSKNRFSEGPVNTGEVQCEAHHHPRGKVPRNLSESPSKPVQRPHR